MKDTLSQVVQDVQILKQANEHLNQELEYAQTEIANLKEKRQDGAVTFAAVMTADNSYGPGDVLIFNQELFPGGGHYSTTTGKFTCPSEGQYFFSWTIDARCSRHSFILHNL